MNQYQSGAARQGLAGLRFFLVLGSLAPLFLLWAIRGNMFIPDVWLVPACFLFVVIPNVILIGRRNTVRRERVTKEITVGQADDHRDHLIVYVFTILIPIYALSPDSWRDIYATGAVLVLIIFIFWHLNLHYMNVVFALMGYRVFTIYPPEESSSAAGRQPVVLITTRVHISRGETITAHRLSDTVFWEM